MIILTACTTGERGRKTAVGGTNHQSNTAKQQGQFEPHAWDSETPTLATRTRSRRWLCFLIRNVECRLPHVRMQRVS